VKPGIVSRCLSFEQKVPGPDIETLAVDESYQTNEMDFVVVVGMGETGSAIEVGNLIPSVTEAGNGNEYGNEYGSAAVSVGMV